jgi:hypothetical protein
MKRIEGYSGHERLVLRTALRLWADPCPSWRKGSSWSLMFIVVVNRFLLLWGET